jgi:pyruvate,water dikinase
MTDRRFPSPFEVDPPEGDISGWEELYPYSVVFSELRREYEEGRFWFQDSMHWGDAMTPWDSTFLEFAIASLGQFNSRHYRIPPADGIDFRVLYGYPYFSPVTIDDPARIGARVPEFVERAGHYFANWNDLYEQWLTKVRENIEAIDAIDFSPLPEMEPLDVITSGRGIGSGWDLQEQYHRFKDLCLRTWQYHFEFLNLGYAAYLDYFGFCKQAWPTIPDLAIARMVAGVEVDLFKPNEKLKELAKLAVESGLARVFDTPDDAAGIQAALADLPGGDKWQAAWEAAADPWFNFSSGTGFYFYDKVWVDYPEIPYAFIRDYISKIEAGVDISRPIDEIVAERDRIVDEYADLLLSDEDRATFHGKLGLARVVFPYVENHNFYIEHWSMSRCWRKLRELGAVLAKEGFIADPQDVVYFRRDELDEVLWDVYSAWAVNAPAAGPSYWPDRVARRKEIVAACSRWQPPKALGKPPEVVTEPFTIMLWGITSDSVKGWLGGDDDAGGNRLSGMGASPGVVEGPARLVFSAADIGSVLDGEILVTPITAPSWAPVFPKIKACVTDIGGMMSHAAIVCREYGVPAVTGTGFGTNRIRTGQRIRVDGAAGTVELLD